MRKYGKIRAPKNDDVVKSGPPAPCSSLSHRTRIPFRSFFHAWGLTDFGIRESSDNQAVKKRNRATRFTWSAISSALESTSCEITIVVHCLSKTEKIYPCTHTDVHTCAHASGTARCAQSGAARGREARGAMRGESKRMVGAPDTTRSRRAPLRPCPCDVEIGWLADCARIISGVRGRRTRVGAVRPRNVEFDSRPFAPLPTSRLASQAAKNLNARIRILNFFSCWLNEKFLNYLYRPF